MKTPQRSAPGGLGVDVRSAGHETCHIMLSGRLDLSTYDRLERAFEDVLDGGWQHLVVDLSQVQYIASAGMGIFLEAMATVEERGGSLRFVNLSEEVERVFTLLGGALHACGFNASTASPQKPGVLIVDDDPETLNIMSLALGQVDCELHCASGAREALEILDAQRGVCLIIADWLMPEKDGMYLLEEVQLRWPWIERILYTGCRPPLDEVVRSLERGVFSRFISKPWDLNKLARTTSVILAEWKSEDGIRGSKPDTRR